MNYRVKLTHAIRRDLQKASDYIAGELKNPTAADRLTDEAEAAICSLRDMPFVHPLVMDEFLAGQGIRLMPVRNYVMFYVVREESKMVTALRFLYGGQDWIAILKGGVTPE
jgi:plasmid stabilization system protein ParE